MTDGTKTRKKNLEDKGMSAFYMDPERLDTRDIWQWLKRSHSLSVSLLQILKKTYTRVEEP